MLRRVSTGQLDDIGSREGQRVLDNEGCVYFIAGEKEEGSGVCGGVRKKKSDGVLPDSD